MTPPFVGAVIDAFHEARNVALHAPTGAGKSTLLPLELLRQGAVEGQIVLVQPRQIAARAVASRIAELYGCVLGEEVGYQVRFERKMSRKTRLLVVTDGIALQMIQRDPSLEGVGALLLDEFHERSTNLDLLLAFARETQLALRDDLRLGVLSATLEIDRVLTFLDASLIEATTRRFPLAITYASRSFPRPWENAGWEHSYAQWIADALAQTAGDALVFLPGVGEILRVSEALAPKAKAGGFDVQHLYGGLSLDEQARVLHSGARRRVVLSTNVAETSLTVPGIDVVVDFGWVRRARLSPSVGLNRLVLERVSRASADQRAGRAGRIQAGAVFRAWTDAEHHRLDAAETPEIQRVDVATAVLEVLRWQGRDAERFGWFEAPSSAQMGASRTLLEMLRLVEGGVLTDLGRAVSSLPLHPRLGVLMTAAAQRGRLADGSRLCALLDDQDFPRGFPSPRAGDESDVDAALDALRAGRGTDPRLQRVRRVAQQLERSFSADETTAPAGDDRAWFEAIALAFPDRLSRRRNAGEARGVMSSGTGVLLDETTSVRRSEYWVSLSLDASRPGELRCACAVGMAREAIPASMVGEESLYRLDTSSGRVEALRRRTVGALVLDERPLPKPDPLRVSAVLEQEILRDPLGYLSDDAGNVRRWLARYALVAEEVPEESLPPLDDAFWAQVVASAVVGQRTLEAVRRQDILGVIRGVIGWRSAESIDRWAPEKFVVPTGSAITIDYDEPGGPVLAVRLQELFGCVDTPTILNGRKRLVLHLLAPNYRPQQVTEDLAGFWERTYPEVRKELRARYPKHAWPDDPRTAAPQRGAKRRGT